MGIGWVGLTLWVLRDSFPMTEELSVALYARR